MKIVKLPGSQRSAQNALVDFRVSTSCFAHMIDNFMQLRRAGQLHQTWHDRQLDINIILAATAVVAFD